LHARIALPQQHMLHNAKTYHSTCCTMPRPITAHVEQCQDLSQHMSHNAKTYHSTRCTMPTPITAHVAQCHDLSQHMLHNAKTYLEHSTVGSQPECVTKPHDASSSDCSKSPHYINTAWSSKAGSQTLGEGLYPSASCLLVTATFLHTYTCMLHVHLYAQHVHTSCARELETQPACFCVSMCAMCVRTCLMCSRVLHVFARA
jgi:hypothetical protein